MPENPPKLYLPKKEIAKDAKTCHRMYSPFVMQAEGMGSPVGGVYYTECAQAKCALWNAEAKECHDTTKAKALHRIADRLDVLDGLLRVGGGAPSGAA